MTNYLAIRSAIMVNVGRGPQPQLCTVLPTGVHDGEVILSRHQQGPLLFHGQLGDAADQEVDLVALLPVLGGADLGTHHPLQGVPVATLDHEAGALVENAKVPENLKQNQSKLSFKKLAHLKNRQHNRTLIRKRDFMTKSLYIAVEMTRFR